MHNPLTRILFVILTAAVLGGGGAMLTPATATASEPMTELANGDRPASVALATSYALLALTVEPLGDGARGAESATATQPPATERHRRERRAGHVIDVTGEPLLDGWLVRVGLVLLGALIVLVGVLELGGKADRQRTAGI